MILEKDISKLFNRLFFNDLVQIHLGGSDVNICLLEENTKVMLIASVYEGGNYIPKSVRRCVSGKPPFSSGKIFSRLVIDEDRFQVRLTYVGLINRFNKHTIKDLLEEFSWQADEWRLYLEEHDKYDLLPIYVK
ncbi:MAG: hypothetical protein H0W50_04615 [Parachlamydiaceae bacterium]|nr:hypothetical protein [Parachlamydiaceae bacterium]